MAHDELSTLDTCALLDKFEQGLKSKEDYLKSIQHIYNKYPNFKIYSDTYLVPFPADWPGWYYTKKLTAQGYSIGQIIPEQGPFHVCLNAQEDTVQIFKFFFDQLYLFVFNKELPQRPKEFRISLCIVATLLGWIMVRKQVMSRFANCKDHEYILLLHLLEDIVPLVFYQYQIFRSGNLDMYFTVMLRMAVLFICWRRRHYNKSTLSWLSDADYQKSSLPEYWSTKLNWLALITEKKVEIWHSILREKTETHMAADCIQSVAKTLASAGFMAEFIECFCPQYFRGKAESDLSIIAGKTAEFLIDLFKKVATNTGKCEQLPREHYQNGNPKGEAKYKLPTFDVEVDTRCFPLSYNHDKITPGLQPNVSVLCDLQECNETNRDVKRLACYHMFHPRCLGESSCCPICETPLKMTAKKLANAFNEGLINATETAENAGEGPSEVSVQSSEERVSSQPNEKDYFKSLAWNRKVESTINSYVGITEPEFVNKIDMHRIPSASPQAVLSTPTLPHVHIQGEYQNLVAFWRFPFTLSQSTIGGRSGSNACTFISLLVAQAYFSNPVCNSLEINPCTPLSQHWIYLFTLAMIQGNNIYDRVTQGYTRDFGVQEATQILSASIPSASASAEFPADLAPQPQPLAELPFYLEQAANQQRTVALFIINGNTVSFVPHRGGYILCDSHIHQSHGALIAFAKKSDVWHLLQFYHELTGRPYTLGL